MPSKTTLLATPPTEKDQLKHVQAMWRKIREMEKKIEILESTPSSDASAVRLTGNQTIAGTKTFTATITGSITGNAATATKLATARAINGIDFDGTAPITIPSNIAPGTSGNVMTSNGTIWISTAPGFSGTVTTVSVVTANGISGTVATATTTPAITLTLGVIAPTSVNGLTLAAAATGFTIAGGTTSKTLTVSDDASVSGTNTGDNATNTQYSSLVTNATHTGDATGSGAITVVGINSTLLSSLSTGILKITTGTGVPSIAIASDFPTLNQDTSGSSASCTGNAATATKLAATKTINGIAFDGSGNITVPSDIAPSTAGSIMTSNGSVWISGAPPAGTGTVTTVSIVTANGISGTVANATTTPAITITLGVIAPTSVNGLTLAAAATGFTIAGGTTSKTLTVSDDATVSGTNTGDNATNSQYSGLVGALAWTEVTAATQAMAIDKEYFANRGTLITFTLPASCAVGKRMAITGYGAGGWLMAQNASQYVIFGDYTTVAGVGGSIASSYRYDRIEIVCVVADVGFEVVSATGSLTMVIS
ncbi:MAG TPA: hypothetical protein DCZ94_21570 [Lentisphaeria bacterium]|nr:MAG: hypothetical protein A2X48_14500 [Lentisphaerae bacterium GWF2_49_21]HBC89535.1 hypothetical protein [Lentisphaeria bacterium]